MKWHILSVDDEPDIGRQIKQFLDGSIGKSGDTIEVEVIQDFDSAMRKLDKMLYDLIILDVFKGKQGMAVQLRPGADLLEDIKKRCFVPVIFYTALPTAVQDQESELVHVVHKTTGGLKQLQKTVYGFIGGGLPKINRSLINHFFKTQAEYMWKFVQPHWKEFGKTTTDKKSLAYLLARRLAISFSRENIHHLVNSLGGSSGQVTDTSVHPVEYYIQPPIGSQYSTGDILGFKKGKKIIRYHVILTPSCDMFLDATRKPKSEYVLVADCIPIKETVEVKEWLKNKSSAEKKNLITFLKNNRKGAGVQFERYYYLPGTFSIPDIYVDFQLIHIIPFSGLKTLEKIASLDSPFAESLLNRFCRYIGRVGTPDIADADLEDIINKVK